MTTETAWRPAALAVALLGLLCGCSPHPPSGRTDGTTASRVASAPVADWALPVGHARQPDLATAPDGSLLLSWTEGEGDRQSLRFARWRDGRWSEPASITRGEGIGNTADTPHLRQTPDGALWATWLRALGEGHARDIVLARSADDGRNWSTPVPVNTDGTTTEHGFASLWPAGRDALGIAWLDGREKAGDAHGHDMAGMHAGAATSPAPAAMQGSMHGMHDMHGDSHREAGAEPPQATMLRSVVLDARLGRHDESAIDTATCDCCQTDVAVLDDGPRLVYRDRDADEVRDIAILARGTGGWSVPHAVHADGWRMPGCPVNGPAIAASGRSVDVAWYTMHDGVPTVRFARSTDGGATFGGAVDLDAASTVLGRIDVASDRSGTWVAWLTESADGQTLRAAHVRASAPVPDRVVDIARLAGRGRGTGWPRLAASSDGVRVVWTDVVDGMPVLRGARLPR